VHAFQLVVYPLSLAKWLKSYLLVVWRLFLLLSKSATYQPGAGKLYLKTGGGCTQSRLSSQQLQQQSHSCCRNAFSRRGRLRHGKALVLWLLNLLRSLRVERLWLSQLNQLKWDQLTICRHHQLLQVVMRQREKILFTFQFEVIGRVTLSNCRLGYVIKLGPGLVLKLSNGST